MNKTKKLQKKQRLRYPSIRGVDPPQIEPLPWIPVTIAGEAEITTDGMHTVTTTQILALAEEQLGLVVTQNLHWNLRLLAVGVWNMSGGKVLVSFADLSEKGLSTGNKSIRTLSDSPARNHWAHVEYTYPQQQRTFVQSEADDSQLLSITANGDGPQKILMHMYILIRSALINEEPGKQMTLTSSMR